MAGTWHMSFKSLNWKERLFHVELTAAGAMAKRVEEGVVGRNGRVTVS